MFKLVKKYPYSSLDEAKSKAAAIQKFRSEIAIGYREWPYCGEHHPHGLPEKVEISYAAKNPEYILTLQCPECQKDNSSNKKSDFYIRF